MTYEFDKYIAEIKTQIEEYKARGLKLFSTSSFQPQSIVLLHIISQVDNAIPIYFLDTRYHFPETVAYRKQIEKQFGLNIVDLQSEIPKAEQVGKDGEPLYKTEPEKCCHINKVQPLEYVLQNNDVWINGVRRSQTANRAGMGKEGTAKHGVLRYHPILEWDSKMVFSYINKYKLPMHPLVREGYFSIGCLPCTAKADPSNPVWSDDRSGRWANSGKTECGLHTTLVEK
ncbi:phosphoadenylyl-sulfate reductase [Limibacter armeniacum]|uniref:phosphoadenylyl-sulfate reductase n=1 Tax=Limibacter armeniacum TaxID=466084 RepID=UPI002FE583A4